MANFTTTFLWYTSTMNILEIYDQFKIPPWLQRHQLEVAAVGLYVVDHWQGSKLNKRALTEALLLHDMGNIVKFKRPFLGVAKKDLAYWERVQDEVIATYGKTTHDVTEAIIKEIGVSKETFEIVRQMRFTADGQPLSESWEAKIADFADTCVTPKGIEGFEARMIDLLERYKGRSEGRVQTWRRTAVEVQENVDVELDLLQNEDYSVAIEALKQTEI